MHIGQYKPIKDPMITIKQQIKTVTLTIIMHDPMREKYHIACTNDDPLLQAQELQGRREIIPQLCAVATTVKNLIHNIQTHNCI